MGKKSFEKSKMQKIKNTNFFLNVNFGNDWRTQNNCFLLSSFWEKTFWKDCLFSKTMLLKKAKPASFCLFLFFLTQKVQQIFVFKW